MASDDDESRRARTRTRKISKLVPIAESRVKTEEMPPAEKPVSLSLAIELGDPESVAEFLEALARQLRMRKGKTATLVVRLDS